eukprot:GHUV01038563.1.p1 GENE.GHUV01038563.1~~GHUV01038563.1.p1  ORF type:complete len:119 (+),score=21.42 GHUV01038563.1:189-545(+)
MAWNEPMMLPCKTASCYCCCSHNAMAHNVKAQLACRMGGHDDVCAISQNAACVAVEYCTPQALKFLSKQVSGHVPVLEDVQLFVSSLKQHLVHWQPHCRGKYKGSYVSAHSVMLATAC